jgi:hypothetical protein
MISTDLSPEASAHVVVDIPYHPVLPDFNQERVEIGVHHKLRKLCSEESPRRDMSQGNKLCMWRDRHPPSALVR